MGKAFLGPSAYDNLSLDAPQASQEPQKEVVYVEVPREVEKVVEVFVDRIVEVPVETIIEVPGPIRTIEKTVYVDKPVEIIKEKEVIKNVEVQVPVEVVKYIDRIKMVKESKTPMWCWIMAAYVLGDMIKQFL